jgi:hypothetical protein
MDGEKEYTTTINIGTIPGRTRATVGGECLTYQCIDCDFTTNDLEIMEAHQRKGHNIIRIVWNELLHFLKE